MEYTLLTKCLLEFIATLVLILLGDGVVACVCLNKTKGQGAGWVVITFAWGFAVAAGVLIAGPYTGAHLNPAVTLSLAIAGSFPWDAVIPFFIAQIAGAFCGAALVWLFYKDHFDATPDQPTKLGVFCTIPAIRNYGSNFFSEMIGTFVLLFAILCFGTPGNVLHGSIDPNGTMALAPGLAALGPIPVTIMIIVIGMALGGTTGYAINPARDFGPRLAHAVLPIKGKGSSDWAYSWVPILGPLVGGALAVGVYKLFFELWFVQA